MLQAIITVMYSDISELGEEQFCIEDESFSITPLHADMNKNDACHQDCSDQYLEMLKDLIESNKLDIEEYTLYHSIFKVKLCYSEDYYGEVDMDYELELIDHAKVGEFDEDNNLTYTDQSFNNEMVELIELKYEDL
ncbi:hypothetical protein VPHF99_0054 [Vibrio phage F99]|nr:hypothetical protein MYOV085v1_p0083 [Vibrio phage 355E48.1]